MRGVEIGTHGVMNQRKESASVTETETGTGTGTGTGIVSVIEGGEKEMMIIEGEIGGKKVGKDTIKSLPLRYVFS